MEGDEVGFVTARRAVSNTAALNRVVRQLRRADRLDEPADLLCRLLATSADLVDEACSPTSDVAAYARANMLRVHGMLIAQLAARLRPASGRVDDPWERIARELTPNYDLGPMGDAPEG